MATHTCTHIWTLCTTNSSGSQGTLNTIRKLRACVFGYVCVNSHVYTMHVHMHCMCLFMCSCNYIASCILSCSISTSRTHLVWHNDEFEMEEIIGVGEIQLTCLRQTELSQICDIYMEVFQLDLVVDYSKTCMSECDYTIKTRQMVSKVINVFIYSSGR